MKIHALKEYRLLAMVLPFIALLALIGVTRQQEVFGRQQPSAQQQSAPDPNEAALLSFSEFFEPGIAELKPSAKLLAMRGRRVRMVGFMARMEEPLHGAFYLTPRPVFCDEEGGGNADLPAATVLVIVRSAKEKEVAFIPGALEVTGILEVGSRREANGQISAVRLVLDGPQDQLRTPGAPGQK